MLLALFTLLSHSNTSSSGFSVSPGLRSFCNVEFRPVETTDAWAGLRSSIGRDESIYRHCTENTGTVFLFSIAFDTEINLDVFVIEKKKMARSQIAFRIVFHRLALPRGYLINVKLRRGKTDQTPSGLKNV